MIYLIDYTDTIGNSKIIIYENIVYKPSNPACNSQIIEGWNRIFNATDAVVSGFT